MYTAVIEKALEKAFAAYPIQVSPVLSAANKNGGGDFQCNSVLQLAGRLRLKPADLARQIADKLDLDGVANVTVTGPGYLNFILTDGFVESAARASCGKEIEAASKPETVVLDFGGPNIAKALHVGHLRSFVIGESLRRILGVVGHKVVSDIHYGDWGLPIGKLFLGIESHVVSLAKVLDGGLVDEEKAERLRTSGSLSVLGSLFGEPGASLPKNHALPYWTLDDLGEFYRLGNQLTKEDSALYDKAKELTSRLQGGDESMRLLWKHVRGISLRGIEDHIEALGAHFDMYDGESDVDPLIPAMLSSLIDAGLAVESDGALVGPVVEDESLPPVLLRKRDGSSLYGTTDLATIVDRIAKYRPDKIVYCVDGRQDVHLKTCFMLARKAADAGVCGFDALPELIHADFGTVNDSSGKPYSTRDGKPALLEDLIDEAVAKARESITDEGDGDTARKVAIAALKFADLSTDRRSGYVFDPERMMSFTGRTGPYLQYASVRVASLLRKAEQDGGSAPTEIGINHPADRALAIEVLRLPAAVHRAATDLQPKAICDAAYEIAVALSRLYVDVQVLKAPPKERSERLALVGWAAESLRNALYLLGIETPEKM